MLTHIIDDIRNLIGRCVYFYIPSTTECPTCTLDPIANTSTDSTCVTCSGLYYITTYSGVGITGHLTWGNMDEMQWPAGGQYFDGDARLQIKYTEENVDYVRNCDYVIADSVKMSIKRYAFRGVPDLNRIVIILDQEEEGD